MGREEEMAILERAWFYQLCGQMGSQLTQGVSPSPLHGKGGGARAEELGSSIHGLIMDLPNVL